MTMDRNTRIFYIRDDARRPVVTIGIQRVATNRVNLCLAICSPKDQFVKATGRSIVFGRLKSDKTTKVTYDVDENGCCVPLLIVIEDMCLPHKIHDRIFDQITHDNSERWDNFLDKFLTPKVTA